ncbi:MAG: ABC transporter permease [Bacteroidales bacterium]|jgi:putative ABC transport system permease protein|nr:ABC transporter permease [Bacteroidales bacterium]
MKITSIIEDSIISILQNRLRSFLAGFGIAWGIFLLMILLGIGQGFRSGINSIFDVFAQKTLFLISGQTSQIVEGGGEGQTILFDQSFMKMLSSRFNNHVVAISPVLNLENAVITHKEKAGTFLVRGISNEYFFIKKVKAEDGRLLNPLDDLNNLKHIVVGKQVVKHFFPEGNSIGQYLNINDIFFRVIGILESGSMMSQEDESIILCPYTTYINYFNRHSFNRINLLLKESTDMTQLEKKVRQYVAKQYNFSENDQSALYIINQENQVKVFNNLFSTIDIFLWIIGVCLLLSGIVGICNIMLVMVRERTKEIGIRKAIGAKKKEILFSFLCESMVITIIAGMIGLGIGYCFILIINYVLSAFINAAMISHLSINVWIVISSLILLILSGILAGLYPAQRAAKITPVEAMQYE